MINVPCWYSKTYVGHPFSFAQFNSIRLETDKNLQLLRLWRLTGNPNHKEEIISRNYALIASLALKRCRKADMLDDLIQESAMGFSKGLERYDYDMAISNGRLMKLTSYCANWSTKFINLYLEKFGDIVAIPWRPRRAAKKYEAMVKPLALEFGTFNIPVDFVFADQTNSVRLGVIDVMHSKNVMDSDDMDLAEEREERTDAEDLINHCPILSEGEKAFVVGFFKESRTSADRSKFNQIIARVKTWVAANNTTSNKDKAVEKKISEIAKVIKAGAMPDDGMIEDVAELIYERDKDPKKKIDGEKAAEMRGMIAGMQLFKQLCINAKGELI